MKNLLLATIALAFVMGATESLADNRRGNDRGRAYDHGWDRGFTPPGHQINRGIGRVDRNRTRVSINVNLNDRWRRPAYQPYAYNRYNSFNSFGYSMGFGSWGSAFNTWSTPARVIRQRQPLVVYQNTYINNPVPRSTITTTVRSGTSLLRDINGRCFERSTDRYGNETRIELPVSACNF